MKKTKLIIIISFFFTLTFANQNYELSQKIFDDTQIAEIHIHLDADSLIWLYNNVDSDKYFSANMRYKNNEMDTVVNNIGFRLRGNTSRNSRKKSFKVSFPAFESGRRFFGLKKFNLNGEHNDPSIIRAKLCWDLFKNMDIHSSRCSYTKVYINDTYFGLYLNVEHYDDIFLDSRFGNDAGNFYKCLWPSDLTYRSSNPNDYKFNNGGRRTYDLKTNEDEDNYTDLSRFIRIINNTPDNNFADSLYSVFNIWDFLKVVTIDVLTGSWDDYWFLKNNFYLYNDPIQGKFQFVPYDYDNSFGISWFHDRDWGSENVYAWGNQNGQPRPLIDRILEVQQFKDLYTYFINHALENYFNSSVMEPRIDLLKSMITTAAETDQFRTYDYGFSIDDFHNSYSSSLDEHNHVTYGIKPFIMLRNITANSQLIRNNIAPYFVNDPIITFLPENKINIIVNIFDEEVPEVTLFYESPEGNKSVNLEFTLTKDEDKIPVHQFVTTIELDYNIETFDYYFEAMDNSNITSHFPFNAPGSSLSIKIPNIPKLYINEFLASNDAIIYDEQEEYDDWIELFNGSDEIINLLGYYLSDNPANPTKWEIPDITIEPGKYLLIWADEDSSQGTLHANFKLDKDGEYIGIYKEVNNDIITIDSYYYSPQESDTSFGRISDGEDSWVKMVPTPGASNNSTSITNEEIVVNNCHLYQNYPNPFNPTTKIQFYISKPEIVRLEVYNLLGGKIKTLINQKKFPGFHEVTLDGSSLTSGMYIYKLQVDGHNQFKKCLLIK